MYAYYTDFIFFKNLDVFLIKVSPAVRYTNRKNSITEW